MSLVSSRETKAIPDRARESNDAGCGWRSSERPTVPPGAAGRRLKGRGLDQRQGDRIT